MSSKRSDASKCVKALEASFKENDKIAIFVDGYTTSAACNLLNMKIDWNKVGELFRYLCRVNTINFYISTPSNFNNRETDMKPLADWLAHNGYKVVTEKGYHYDFIENQGLANQFDKKGYKTGYDITLAADALMIADKVDKVVLFSANNDFCPLVAALQSKGVPVIVITNSLGRVKKLREEQKISSTGNIGVQLIRVANEFFELEDIRPEVEHTVVEDN